MIGCPVYPSFRALGSGEAGSLVQLQLPLFRGRLVPERHGRCQLCLCTLRFLRQILGMRVRSDWMVAGRGRHSGGGIRKQKARGWISWVKEGRVCVHQDHGQEEEDVHFGG